MLYPPFPWMIAQVNPVSSGLPQSDPEARSQDQVPLSQSGYTPVCKTPQCADRRYSPADQPINKWTTNQAEPVSQWSTNQIKLLVVHSVGHLVGHLVATCQSGKSFSSMISKQKYWSQFMCIKLLNNKIREPSPQWCSIYFWQ